MSLIGKHLITDMYGCNSSQLSDSDFLKEVMLTAIKEANMTLLDFSCQAFQPQGLTAVALLAESHMTIHTYPEIGYAAIDVFTCGDHSHPERAIAVWKKLLHPEKTKTTHVRRGDLRNKDMKPKVNVTNAPLRRVKNTGAKMLNLIRRAK